jgi:hypothetical protein
VWVLQPFKYAAIGDGIFRFSVPHTKDLDLLFRDLTTLLSDHVADFSIDDLSDRAIYRSKRMILDSIGVGTIGSQTEIAGMLREFALIYLYKIES